MVAPKKTSWKITSGSWNRVVKHVLGEYPKEACGILLCSGENPSLVMDLYPTKNVTAENPATRYFIDAVEFLDVVNWGEQRGLDVLGFYHSHPDHPAIPSEYDRHFAWESYVYLIISVRDGIFAEARAWLWDPAAFHFEETVIQHHEQEGARETPSPHSWTAGCVGQRNDTETES